MPTVSQIIKLRNLRYTKEIHHPWMKVGLICGLVLSLLSVIIIIIGFWYYADLTRDLPSIDALPSLIEPPNGTMLQPTRLYDRTFTHVILTLEDPAAAGKQYLYVKADNPVGGKPLPQYLVDATLSASDPSFWKNPGFSFAGISKGTHPTLAQLLISNLILDTELPSIRRNIRERILAAQVTAHFGREKILEWYLNSAQYGENIYGVDAAARVYFGKSATKLSLAEAAMLVAIAETPSIEALTSPKTFMDQQHQTLQAMLTNGFISATDAQKALNENIQFVTHPETQLLAPAFTDLVLMQLSTALPLGRIRHGGYEIITTLDYELQSQADCASKVQLSRIQRTEERPVTFDSTPCDAARLLPTLQSGDEKPRQDLNVNVVILDPHSGQIMALVGDNTSGMDPAYPSVHSAGTILSPFLYLTAFTRGMSPSTLIWDIPSASGTNGLGSTQSKVTQGISLSYHGPVRLRMAFVNDYAGAATEVLQQVGADNVWLTERRFGITPTEVEPISGASLDDLYSQQIDLLESVQAYAILANQGIMTGQPGITNPLGNNLDGLYPTSILRVMGVDGQVWLDWSTAQSRSIVSSQLAYLTTNVLSDENARWLSLGHPNALEIGRPAAAKIGLTINGNGAWTVGYIPQLAIGVWVGHSQNESGGISAEIPAGLWHAMMQYGSNQEPVEDFNMPTGITRVQVCDPSGLLVSIFCPAIVQEVFLNGDEPTRVDDLYQKFYINRETGLLATVFTPSEMLEEKIYLVVPPQAVPWAKEAGLPIAPDSYDIIYAPPAASNDFRFSSPQMFDHVGGRINFIGSAKGSGFSYYRLQVGQGLNPQQWIQVGEDVDQPVNEGLLGTWDTKGLEGLYVIQLLVVRSDQRVDRAILQVTIDNTAPQVQILTPTEREQFAFRQGESILIQISASDNLVLERIEFYIDGELVSTLLEPPLIILWPARTGEHSLVVKAYDLAHNVSEVAVGFSVHK